MSAAGQRVEPGERVAFVGKTGSGKTFAARALALHIPRLIVIDPKGTLSDAYLTRKGQPIWGLQDWDADSERRLARGEPVRTRVPAPLDLNWEPYFRYALEAENVTVYIDEMYGVVPPRANPGRYLTALYTRGREPEVGTWAATQRPRYVPYFMFSEAEWIFLFRLQMDADRDFMADQIGPEALSELKDRQFHVYHADWERAEYYDRIESVRRA